MKLFIKSFCIVLFFLIKYFPIKKVNKLKKIGLFAISGAKKNSSAGDSSILEFSNLYSYSFNGISECNQIKLSGFVKNMHFFDNSIIITRDISSFIIAYLFKFFFMRKYFLIYYSTDIFSNRISPDNNFFTKIIIKKYNLEIEKLVWKKSDYIFCNRNDEANIISSINKNVKTVPAQSRPLINNSNNTPNKNKPLKFIFIGAFGNVPNKISLAYIVEELWPKVLNKYPNAELNVVGDGWEKFLGIRDNIKYLGYLTSSELAYHYKMNHFALCYLSYGAGVKGKVLEAMQHQKIVLGNEVAFEGINCEALKSFENYKQLLHIIKYYINDNLKYQNDLKKYQDFLMSQYDVSNIHQAINESLEHFALEVKT